MNLGIGEYNWRDLGGEWSDPVVVAKSELTYDNGMWNLQFKIRGKTKKLLGNKIKNKNIEALNTEVISLSNVKSPDTGFVKTRPGYIQFVVRVGNQKFREYSLRLGHYNTESPEKKKEMQESQTNRSNESWNW
jgi:hypothetical protein